MSKVEIIKRPVEKIGSALKKTAWMSVLESLLTLILGILLVVWPEIVLAIIAYVVGAFFIIKGGYQIVNYFLMNGRNNFFNNDLLWGVVAVLIGIAVLVSGEDIAGIFRVVVGIWMIYEALARMNTAIKLNAAKIGAWKYVLILALAMLVFGCFITFYQGAVLVLIGWMMVLTGLAGIVGDIVFIQHVNAISDRILGTDK